ncbi:MAG: helix-turn-helix transcriptional regulator [Kiritimatiellae bacterium]|nr:helix-turn-helix transcriptional regulator [Kiritimatiellia bacterium]
MDAFKYLCTKLSVAASRRLSITAIAYRMRRGGTTRTPLGREHYAFLFFYDEAFIGAPGTPKRCPPHTLVIFEPGAPASFGNDAGEWEHTWMHANGYFIRSMLRRNGIPVNVPILLGSPRIVETYLLALHEEITRHYEPDPVILQNTFANFVRELRRHVHGDRDAARPVPQRLVEIRNYIEANYHKPIRLEALAAMAGWSAPYFGALFKRHFGVSPIDLVIRQRMEEAALLLGDANMSVSQVAETVGYADIYYFSKLFKKHHRLSPSRYRRRRYGKTN